eukprot:187463-Rhodomonas_salina.1
MFPLHSTGETFGSTAQYHTGRFSGAPINCAMVQHGTRALCRGVYQNCPSWYNTVLDTVQCNQFGDLPVVLRSTTLAALREHPSIVH